MAGPLRPRPAGRRRPSSARLPQRLPLSGEELDAIELFLRRAGKLSRAREVELAEMVAPRLRPAHGRPLQGRAALPRRAPLPRPRAPHRDARDAPQVRRGRLIGSRSQDEFVAARSRDWHELDRLLVGGDSLHRLDGATISRAAALYRSLCTDLMRCRAARYTPDLRRLPRRARRRAHAALYGAQPFRVPGGRRLLRPRLPPGAPRQRALLLPSPARSSSSPSPSGLLGALASDEFAAKVIPPPTLEGMAHAYSKGFAGGRDAGTDTGMAGFYVFNNVGIAFRCFATGILYGAGSLFFLVYNGLVTGTVVGYVMSAGHGGNIWTFMCGHAPFELTAIVIAGGAGLQMGYALVDTGGLTRVGSLRRAAPVDRPADPGRGGDAADRRADRGLLVALVAARAGQVVRLGRLHLAGRALPRRGRSVAARPPPPPIEARA